MGREKQRKKGKRGAGRKGKRELKVSCPIKKKLKVGGEKFDPVYQKAQTARSREGKRLRGGYQTATQLCQKTKEKVQDE